MEKESLDLDKINNLFSEYTTKDNVNIQTYMSLIFMSMKLLGRIESYFRKLNLSNTQVMIMIILLTSDDEFETPFTLAHKTGFTKATISSIMATLYKNNFIEKKAVPNDSRSYQVIPTEKGRKVIEDIIPDYHLKIIGILKNFDKDELESLKLLTSKLYSDIEIEENN